MSDSSATLSAGDVVGKYKILGMAGAGGMGVVYRALDTKLERTVALKFLPEHAVSSPEEKDRFLREARFASALDHPNVGVIYGIEEEGHRTFIVMAYYTGETVAHRIRRAPISLAEAVDIAIQVGEGLTAAHAGTVVHRDIKPSNIIVTQQGVAKIVDFGLARLASATGSTQSVSTAGTIGYMSPEQTIGKFLDQRTDIWSLGVVLAEMVTGHHPFQRDTPAATIYAILNEPPSLRDDLPLDLLRVIYRALSKEPETRYPNCKELVADLHEVRSHLDPAAAPVASGPITRPSSPGASKTSNRLSTLTASELRKQIEQASRPVWATNTAPASRWTRWLVGTSLVVLVLAILSFLTPVRERLSSLFGRTEEHIAVLPFENAGNDPANTALADGLMDSLTSRLSNLENGKQPLWVVPASEVRRRHITDPAAALRELGATVAIEGGFQRDAQTVRITVNLINTKNMRQVGSAIVEDRAGDFSSLEDQTVMRMAKLMHIDAPPEMLRAVGGSVAGGAYELYLKALGYTQRYDKAGNLDLAINALNQAVRADPRFALAYAQLGEAYRDKYQLDKDTKWLDQALANCNKAIEVDDRLPAAYVTLGHIHHATGKYDLALQEYQRAIQLDARNADAQIGLAQSYDSAGHTAEAEAAYRKAIALRPDSWNGYNALANFLDDHQRFDEAIAQFQHAIQLTPDNAALYLNLAAAFIDKGDTKSFPQAEQALQKSLSLGPSYPAYANLGYLYIQEKKYPEAADTIQKALQLNDKDQLVWGNLASAYEHLGQNDKANQARDRQIALLEQGAQTTPRDAVVQSLLAFLYAKKNLREKALSRIQSALVLAPDDANVLENVGEAYEYLGDRTHALQYIETSIQKGYSLDAIRDTPNLKGLVSDPRFHPVGK